VTGLYFFVDEETMPWKGRVRNVLDTKEMERTDDRTIS